MNLESELVAALKRARRVTVLTGAGVSAESGVPTFRDAQTGLWADFRPEDLATPSGFLRNPQLVWEWYAWRRERVNTVAPNPAHHALAAMADVFPEFHLITQNVDGLHQRAGSRDVIELHGNITRTKCFDEGTVVAEWKDTGHVPPQCPHCGGHLRPDVVWFEEMLPVDELQRATHAAMHCDVFLSIGTSGLVYPAAGLPLQALGSGATVIEVNPEPTPLTARVHFAISSAAGVALPRLVEQLRA